MLDYSKKEVPGTYVCKKCWETNCRLYREINDQTHALFCAVCAAKEESVDISTMDDSGVFNDRGEKTDKIGWYIPAIPLQNLQGYWLYSEETKAARGWWCRLPSKSDGKRKGPHPKGLYYCAGCGEDECKLWGMKNFGLLFCVTCAAESLSMDPHEVDENGKIHHPLYPNKDIRTDQFGPYVPAIPKLQEKGYWKYKDAPLARVDWWRQLPTHKIHPQELFFQ